MSTPIYIDATMLYRWRELAPVGIVRLERLLAAHLRLHSTLDRAGYVLWDRGYRDASTEEADVLDAVLRGNLASAGPPSDDNIGTPVEARSSGALGFVRTQGLKALGRLPDHLRPFGEQAVWSTATFAVESGRHLRRARERRRTRVGAPSVGATGVTHRTDFSRGADLIALGLGWEYLDHEAMYALKQSHGVRIHMPAFDLIPVLMPQMNAGQSHLVHRYYAEMAHYADTITCISDATHAALQAFYREESLPIPHLVTNPLPGFDAPALRKHADDGKRRHRFEGQRYVLSVSTVEIRKNHLLLAKIWAECAREEIDLPRLVIVGRIGWDVSELLQWVAHAPELDERVTIASDVDDDELMHLYEDAEFTVFPSRIEGWGLPITESLTYGKVCIHSTDPAQVEASQGLMPALHPDDFLGWKAEIERVAHDSAYRGSLEQAITDRYVRRSPGEYCRAFEAILAERRIDR